MAARLAYTPKSVKKKMENCIYIHNESDVVLMPKTSCSSNIVMSRVASPQLIIVFEVAVNKTLVTVSRPSFPTWKRGT